MGFFVRSIFAIVLTAAVVPGFAAAQSRPRDLVLRGGMLIDAVRDGAVPNPGILLRAGKIAQIGEPIDTANAEVIRLGNDQYLLPGFFDLHAHYAIDFFGAGRMDETTVYPTLFLANGVTSTFPAGEMHPNEMRELRDAHRERRRRPGPRIYNSGPYFGTARPGWTQTITAESIYPKWITGWSRARKDSRRKGFARSICARSSSARTYTASRSPATSTRALATA